MAYELQNGQGTLSRNRHKTNGDKRPEWTGEVLVDGVLKDIAGWEKASRDGGFFLSLKVSEKRAARAHT